jgi:hypothetical protein
VTPERVKRRLVRDAPSHSTQEDTPDGRQRDRHRRIDVHGYDLTYAHGDYVMSSGRVVNVLPSTVVRIRTRGGLEGSERRARSEAPTCRHSPKERGPPCASSARHSSGWTPRTAAVTDRMDATLRGHEYAKSARRGVLDILGPATETSSPRFSAARSTGRAAVRGGACSVSGRDGGLVERERAGGIHTSCSSSALPRRTSRVSPRSTR